MKYTGYSSFSWLRLKQLLLILICAISLFILFYLAQTRRNHEIMMKLSPRTKAIVKPVNLKPHPPRRTGKTPRPIIDIPPDPLNVYIMSTYYYPTSESIGDNGVALALVPPKRWMQAIQGTITVRATNDLESRTTLCTVEKTNEPGLCSLHGAFAGCHGIANMTKFEISLGNETFHEIPFKTVSYEKRDVVHCIAPLFAAERWHQVFFAAHIYRHYGSFMHLYIRSVTEPLYDLIKVYEKEGYLKTQSYPRLKYSSIPEYMVNPNIVVSLRAQESAQTDCLLQYKESAEFIMFVDLDDILIPRAAPTYFEEFNLLIQNAEYIFYHKANTHYETNNDAQEFSLFDIFHSVRFLDQIETGKVAVRPKYINHTAIHWVEKNRQHLGARPLSSENAIIHLKKEYPLGHFNETEQLSPYFYKNDTMTFNANDTVTIEEDYKRISSKYPEVWKKLPNSLTYYNIISRCYTQKFYNYWYVGHGRQIRWCVNPDLCRIPPKLIAPCANADADHFSSEDGTVMNVHYPKNHRFTIQDRCIT